MKLFTEESGKEEESTRSGSCDTRPVTSSAGVGAQVTVTGSSVAKTSSGTASQVSSTPISVGSRLRCGVGWEVLIGFAGILLLMMTV